jgi:hypothetical protein
VVKHPLPILKNGVVLLDTPGLDDDPLRTARTLSSLPDADAVIVVLSATRFLTDLERRTLRRDLLPLGLTNLFFPVTMVDLLDAISDDPERDLASMHERARAALGPLCMDGDRSRFEERFFPLDARGALQARWDRKAGAAREPSDQDRFEQSGVAAFEASLERFLVSERGTAQLRHLVSTAVRIEADLARRAAMDRATAHASVAELRARQEELKPRFGELAVIAKRVRRTTDAFIGRQAVLVWQDLRDFMVATERALPEAVAGFDLGGLAGLDLLTQVGRARVEARLRSELEGWLEGRVTAWQRSLQPRIEGALEDLRSELVADAEDFDDLSKRIVTDFAGGAFTVPRPETEDPDLGPVERWFSVAAGAMLLSPGAMAAGWSQGYEGMMKGIASRIGVRLAILTLGAVLGPIGWAGIALYVVSDAVLLMLTGGGQLRRLREQLAEALEGQLVRQADSARPEIEARVREGLTPLRDALAGAAEAEAAEIRALLDRTIVEREQAARDAAARGEAWDIALERFATAIEALRAPLEGMPQQ